MSLPGIPLAAPNHCPADAVPGRLPADKLRAACRELEGVFLAMLLREMRATVPRQASFARDNGVLPQGIAGDIFDSLWTHEIAVLGAQSGPLGLTDLLVQQLSPNPARRSSPAGEPTADSPAGFPLSEIRHPRSLGPLKHYSLATEDITRGPHEAVRGIDR